MSILFGMLRLKNYHMVETYKEEACTAVRAVVKQVRGVRWGWGEVSWVETTDGEALNHEGLVGEFLWDNSVACCMFTRWQCLSSTMSLQTGSFVQCRVVYLRLTRS